MNRCSKTILAKKKRLYPTWVLGELCHQWSCLPQLHDSLIPSPSQSLKPLEMLGKSGRLFVVLAHCHSRVGTTYQLPPDPVLKIYHMALRDPLLVFYQILCFGKEFVIWAIRVFSLNFFSSKPTSSQKLSFLFPSPLFLSLSGDLVKVAPPPNHSSPAFPQVPPKCSSLFSEICIFHFHFFPSATVLLPIHKFSLNLIQRTPFSFSSNVSSHLQMSEKWLLINCQKKPFSILIFYKCSPKRHWLSHLAPSIMVLCFNLLLCDLGW